LFDIQLRGKLIRNVSNNVVEVAFDFSFDALQSCASIMRKVAEE
jgi:hypothetical protein